MAGYRKRSPTTCILFWTLTAYGEYIAISGRNGMKRRIMRLLVIVCAISITSGCANAVRIDGPYEGRIIDAETGQPIEGVVVLGVWYREMPTVAGAVTRYYDASETTTDARGNFRIKGQGSLVASDVLPAHMLMFKAGYQYESGSWSALKKYAKNIRWEGEKAIITFRRLNIDERRSFRARPPYPPTDAPLNKVKLMLNEINKNEKELGAEPIDIWSGERL